MIAGERDFSVIRVNSVLRNEVGFSVFSAKILFDIEIKLAMSGKIEM